MDDKFAAIFEKDLKATKIIQSPDYFSSTPFLSPSIGSSGRLKPLLDFLAAESNTSPFLINKQIIRFPHAINSGPFGTKAAIQASGLPFVNNRLTELAKIGNFAQFCGSALQIQPQLH